MDTSGIRIGILDVFVWSMFTLLAVSLFWMPQVCPWKMSWILLQMAWKPRCSWPVPWAKIIKSGFTTLHSQFAKLGGALKQHMLILMPKSSLASSHSEMMKFLWDALPPAGFIPWIFDFPDCPMDPMDLCEGWWDLIPQLTDTWWYLYVRDVLRLRSGTDTVADETDVHTFRQTPAVRSASFIPRCEKPI